jgi:uncharacterized membrane protein
MTKNFILDLLTSAALTFLAFVIVTSGAFLISREFYVYLSSQKSIHTAILHVCILTAAALSGLLYLYRRNAFFGLLPVRLTDRFAQAAPAVSISLLYGIYAATQFLTLSFMHAGLETSLWDFGFNDNIIWNTAHGKFLMLSVRGGQNALGEHFTPIFILLAPLYWITNSAYALFLVQALVIAACIPLTYAIARKLDLSHGSSLILAVAVFFYQPLRNGLLHSFQAQTFADPFLLLGFLCLLYQKNLPAMFSLAVALMGKENIVMEVFGIGFFMIAQGRRIGWGIAALAGAVLTFNTQVIEPAYQFDNNWNKWGYYSHITHPSAAGWTEWARSFFSFPTFRFLYLVFGPLLFLPFKAPKWIWLLGPTLAVRLLTPFIGFRIITAHYTAGLNALLFIAAAYGLSCLSGKAARGVRIGLVIAALLFAGVPQLFRMENHLWEASNPDNQRIVQMLNKVPANYSVVSTETLLAQLTHRHHLFGFGSVMPGAPLEVIAQQPDLLVVDRGRLQPNEKKFLANYQQRGYALFYEYSFLSVWAQPALRDTEGAAALVTRWKQIENSPDRPYRKLMRRYYQKLLAVLVVLFLITEVLRLSRRKTAAI